MAHDVFISYAHQDKPTADAVCAGLEIKGIRCWMAPRDVLTSRLPSTDWHPAILDAIRGSKLMVVVYSSSANGSGQVKRELDAAVRYEVAILPFRIEDVPVSRSLEWFLSLPHWLDALTPPLEKHIENLASTVRVLVESLSERGADGDGGSIAPQPETSDGEGGQGGSIQPPAEISVVEDRSAVVGDLVEQARVALDESRYPDASLLAGQALQVDAGHREAKSLYEAAERLIDVERQLEEARAALRAGSFEQALEPAEAALRADPQNSEAQGLRDEAEAGIASSEVLARAAEDVQRPPEIAASPASAGREREGADESNEHGVIATAGTSLGSAEAERSVANGSDKQGAAKAPTATPAGRAIQFARERPALVAIAAVLLLAIVVLGARRLGPPPSRPLELDQAVSSTLTGGAGASERWELRLASTEDLRIELTNLAVDYDLYVDGPAGSRSSIKTGRDDDILSLSRAPAGNYLIEVKAVSETSSQPYRLVAKRPTSATPVATAGSSTPGCAPSASACPLPLDQPVSAVLTSSTDVHRWQVDMPGSGGGLRIELTDLPADYDLYVTAPDGHTQSSIHAGRSDDDVTFTAAPAGRYQVEVKVALLITPSSQPYRLTARRTVSSASTTAVPTAGSTLFDFSSFFGRPSCPEPSVFTSPLALGRPASGTLSSSDRRHTWSLTLENAVDLRVELSDLQVDYDLYVQTPDGRCESSTRASDADDVVEIRYAPAGAYRIMVSAIADPVARPYSLQASSL